MKMRELNALVGTRITVLTIFGAVQGTISDVWDADTGAHLACEPDVTPANVRLPARALSKIGNVMVDDEGLKWARGWSTEAADALLAAQALSREATHVSSNTPWWTP